MNNLFAQIISNPGLPETELSQTTLTNVLTTAFTILGAISLVIIALQGLRYAMSSGDPQKTKQAKDGILYALAGLIIALMGASITQFTLGAVLNNADQANTVEGAAAFVRNIAVLISFVTGVVSVIMIILAGIKYALSGGDSQKTASAKNTIIYALIGASIASVAAPIVIFTVNQIAG